MPDTQTTKHVAVIGAGIIGLSVAYFLARKHGHRWITLVDQGQPMAFTSAQSGENYRNWWPHPGMVDFTNRSIDLMEKIAQASGNRINMNRRGYVLATRADDLSPLVRQLHDGLQDQAGALLRFHEKAEAPTYASFASATWSDAPDGVDILQNKTLIQRHFPQFDKEISGIIHIRRGGDISGQQLGTLMLEYLREAGCIRRTGIVQDITGTGPYTLDIRDGANASPLIVDQVVNAAGPFAAQVAQMMGARLPLFNTFQQKIAFEDRAQAIPRTAPFSIDLDAQRIEWGDGQQMMAEDPDLAWLTDEMPGAIHCRPDGGDAGRWIKLGWAYNQTPEKARRDLPLDAKFPEIVLRGAARLNPALEAYFGKLPRALHHYGGWYTMTDENWPLIGPMGPPDSFMACAMSGFGTMAACASGELCTDWIAGAELPAYARGFSLARYQDPELMQALRAANRGVL